ncbi:hypothetical protein MIR68_010446 [Amoeboaphelidium protococcarum]|nr:hypothetical protein MIR68_010446 [Amoeboaphelidium protococcarum]
MFQILTVILLWWLLKVCAQSSTITTTQLNAETTTTGGSLSALSTTSSQTVQYQTSTTVTKNTNEINIYGWKLDFSTPTTQAQIYGGGGFLLLIILISIAYCCSQRRRARRVKKRLDLKRGSKLSIVVNDEGQSGLGSKGQMAKGSTMSLVEKKAQREMEYNAIKSAMAKSRENISSSGDISRQKSPSSTYNPKQNQSTGITQSSVISVSAAAEQVQSIHNSAQALDLVNSKSGTHRVVQFDLPSEQPQVQVSNAPVAQPAVQSAVAPPLPAASRKPPIPLVSIPTEQEAVNAPVITKAKPQLPPVPIATKPNIEQISSAIGQSSSTQAKQSGKDAGVYMVNALSSKIQEVQNQQRPFLQAPPTGGTMKANQYASTDALKPSATVNRPKSAFAPGQDSINKTVHGSEQGALQRPPLPSAFKPGNSVQIGSQKQASPTDSHMLSINNLASMASMGSQLELSNLTAEINAAINVKLGNDKFGTAASQQQIAANSSSLKAISNSDSRQISSNQTNNSSTSSTHRPFEPNASSQQFGGAVGESVGNANIQKPMSQPSIQSSIQKPPPLPPSRDVNGGNNVGSPLVATKAAIKASRGSVHYASAKKVELKAVKSLKGQYMQQNAAGQKQNQKPDDVLSVDGSNKTTVNAQSVLSIADLDDISKQLESLASELDL